MHTYGHTKKRVRGLKGLPRETKRKVAKKEIAAELYPASLTCRGFASHSRGGPKPKHIARYITVLSITNNKHEILV